MNDTLNNGAGPIRVNDTLNNGAGRKWGFGQDGQERKCAFELSIIVDVTGQYVLNARGGGKENERAVEQVNRKGSG